MNWRTANNRRKRAERRSRSVRITFSFDSRRFCADYADFQRSMIEAIGLGFSERREAFQAELDRAFSFDEIHRAFAADDETIEGEFTVTEGAYHG